MANKKDQTQANIARYAQVLRMVESEVASTFKTATPQERCEYAKIIFTQFHNDQNAIDRNAAHREYTNAVRPRY